MEINCTTLYWSTYLSFNTALQDAASKGLGLVYEGCSEGQQKEMVDALLRTLMEGKREVQKVSGDTKIFQGSISVEDNG